MNKYEIISLKKKGVSIRQIAKQLNINRRTVTKVWNNHFIAQNSIEHHDNKNISLPEKIICEIIDSKYDSSNRKKRKLTDDVINRIIEILNAEIVKDVRLGNNHKQSLSNVGIHQKLISEGYDIGISTVSNFIREYRKTKEVFIKQEYDLGQRLEFDFGEVKLIIANKKVNLYMAVLGSPASGFGWAYLYENQKKEVFYDSQVKFFSMVGGSYKETVYDNMRNVISKFIGKNEKELNKDLINFALYYDFEIIVTNTYSGNEKGYVESCVKNIRKKIFADKYVFESLDEAREYMQQKLIDLNKDSKIDEEKEHLKKARAPYELADISILTVDKYSCIRVENNFYSVPDYLLDKKVTVKKYVDRIVVYSNQNYVCEHKKIDGYKLFSLDYNHYLNTLKRKPGAIKNSTILKNHPELKAIYNEYYSDNPRRFIEVMIKNNEKSYCELLMILRKTPLDEINYDKTLSDTIDDKSRKQMYKLNNLLN